MLFKRTSLCVAIAALAMAVVNSPLWAQTRPTVTTIAIKGMHCQGCAGKVAALLELPDRPAALPACSGNPMPAGKR